MQDKESQAKGNHPIVAHTASAHAAILLLAVEQSPAAVMITDDAGVIEYANEKFMELSGYSRHEIIGKNVSIFKSGLHAPEYYATLWKNLSAGLEWHGEFHNLKKSGEPYWEYASISPIRDENGHISHFVKIAEDITLRKRLQAELEESNGNLKNQTQALLAANAKLEKTALALKASQRKLRRLADHDPLTGLLNRRGFAEEFRRAQALVERQHGYMGLLVMDVDHFKLFNDQYDHATGDAVLHGCAKLFTRILRASDFLCRYGGDEFLVALPMTNPEETRIAAERLLQAVRTQRVGPDHIVLPVTLSIGAACGQPGQAGKLDTLLRLADHALLRAKQSGRNRILFQESESAAAVPIPLAESLAGINATLATLIAMLDARERNTGEHSKRVAEMAGVLVACMGLPADQATAIRQGALLHDIGKIAVPDAILVKPGPLTPEERAIVDAHPDIGFHILRSSPDLARAAEIVLAHQERYDGKGYPRGLKGRDICLGARLFAVIDTYDAIRAGRPYAPSRGPEEAMLELQRGAGTQFDPDMVAAFAHCQPKIEAIGHYTLDNR